MMDQETRGPPESTGDVIVRLGHAGELVVACALRRTYDRSCSDAHLVLGPLALGSGICVTWRVSIAVETGLGIEVARRLQRLARAPTG